MQVHARAVVDGEMFADLGAGMDVDARLAVCHLGDEPGQEGHAQHMQLMGDAVVAQGAYGGIATDDLTKRARGGVAVVGRFDVGGQQAAQARQRADKAGGQVGGMPPLLVGAGRTISLFAVQTEGGQDLPGQPK